MPQDIKNGEEFYLRGNSYYKKELFDEAFGFYQESALCEYEPGIIALSTMLADGLGCHRNVMEAFYWADSIKDKSATACRLLAMYYYYGIYVPKVISYSKFYLEKAKELGLDVDNILNTSIFTSVESIAPPKLDIKFEKDSICPDAEYMKALELLENKDKETALRVLESSAKSGYSEALYATGILYTGNNSFEIEQNIELSESCLKASALAGNEKAISLLASRALRIKDEKEAKKWFNLYFNLFQYPEIKQGFLDISFKQYKKNKKKFKASKELENAYQGAFLGLPDCLLFLGDYYKEQKNYYLAKHYYDLAKNPDEEVDENLKQEEQLFG